MKYRVKSGDMDWLYETKYHARADALAIMAIHCRDQERLGRLIEVSGGQFRNDPVYLSSYTILRSMGKMKEIKT